MNNTIKEEITKRKQWLFFHTVIKPSILVIQKHQKKKINFDSRLKEIASTLDNDISTRFFQRKKLFSVQASCTKRFIDIEFLHYLKCCESIRKVSPVFHNYLLRKRLRKLISDKRLEFRVTSVILIQKTFRKACAFKKAKHLSLVTFILKHRDKAARKLQKYFRIKLIERRAKYLELSLMIMRARNEASTLIQKCFKRYQAQQRYRSIRQLEKSLPCLKWKAPAEQAFVLGSINDWKFMIKLALCPLRHIFVRYFDGITLGDYEIKFVVDGSYQLNSQYDVIENERYGMVNVFEVRQFRKFGDPFSSEQHQIYTFANTRRAIAAKDGC